MTLVLKTKGIRDAVGVLGVTNVQTARRVGGAEGRLPNAEDDQTITHFNTECFYCQGNSFSGIVRMTLDAVSGGTEKS